MTPKASKLNQAIVAKVQKVLDSTDCIDSIHIEIRGKRGEAPIIIYSITEFIPITEGEE